MTTTFLPQDSLAVTSVEAVERYNAGLRDLLLADPATFWAEARTPAVQRSLDTFQRFARYALPAVGSAAANCLGTARRDQRRTLPRAVFLASETQPL